MADSVVPEKDPETGRFVSGNIGGGRKKGSRNKLGEAFIDALYDDFNEHGVAAIKTVRDERPDQYLKVIASLLPKEMNLNVTEQFSEMTEDELTDRARRLARDLAPLLAGAGSDTTGIDGKAGKSKPARVH
jgi:hypothetical protein